MRCTNSIGSYTHEILDIWRLLEFIHENFVFIVALEIHPQTAFLLVQPFALSFNNSTLCLRWRIFFSHSLYMRQWSVLSPCFVCYLQRETTHSRQRRLGGQSQPSSILQGSLNYRVSLTIEGSSELCTELLPLGFSDRCPFNKNRFHRIR